MIVIKIIKDTYFTKFHKVFVEIDCSKCNSNDRIQQTEFKNLEQAFIH